MRGNLKHWARKQKEFFRLPFVATSLLAVFVATLVEPPKPRSGELAFAANFDRQNFLNRG